MARNIAANNARHTARLLRLGAMNDPIDEVRRKFEREQYEKHKANRAERDRERYRNNPQKFQAKYAISRLVREKQLLPASEYLCAICGGQGVDHHHPSYLDADLLNVVPLCRSCHVKVHHGASAKLRVGAVALAIGIVRISIAGE